MFQIYKIIPLILIAQSLQAYKITIFTDQKESTYAKEFEKLIQTTSPFNLFKIDIEIKNLKSDELNCTNGLAGVARLIECNTKELAANSLDSDIFMTVKDQKEYAGAGGSSPVVSTATPVTALIHEYMHSFGFCDEYEYSKSEAIIFCDKDMMGMNIAIFNPIPTGYTNDEHARSIHSKDIPWYNLIDSRTLITDKSQKILGTSFSFFDVELFKKETPIGLYKAKTCNKASPKIVSWSPHTGSSVMDQVDRPIGRANEILLANALIARGAILKEGATIPNDIPIEEPKKIKTFIENNPSRTKPKKNPEMRKHSNSISH